VKTTEIAQEANQKAEPGAAGVMIALAQEADQVIAKAGQIARQEAEQELDRILKQYEQKTKQITLKIREEAKAKAAEIADSVREAIMQKIEEAAAEAIAETITESGGKVEELAKKRQRMADSVEKPESAEIETAGTSYQPGNLAQQKDARGETGLESGEENTDLEQPVEDFDRWLSQ